MIISLARKFELKQSIRVLLLTKPEITCIEAGEKIGISKNYANKLLNEIREENAEGLAKELGELNKSTDIKNDYVNFLMRVRVLNGFLYEILDDRKSSKSERLRAIQTAFTIERSLLDSKMNLETLREVRKGVGEEISIPYLVGLIKSNLPEEVCL